MGQVADGTLIHVDPLADDNFVLVGCVKSATPPPRERERVDDTCLEDTRRKEDTGVEQSSDFVFRRNYQPGGTVEASLRTLYDSKASVPFRLTYPFSPAETETFNGKVAGLVTEELENGSQIQQTVTIAVQSASTFA